MINTKSSSLADQIFERLENDILTGRYERFDILTEAKLSEELGVSRTPIREALRRLEQEHLIEDGPKGMTVLGITPEDAEYIFTIRREIEGIAAAACAKHITDEQLADLTDTYELQAHYLEKENRPKIRSYDSDFHQKIFRYSGSVVLYDTLTLLHRKTMKYRTASIQDSSRAQESVKEHKAILDAIAAHDEEGAKAAMTAHVTNAQAHLEKILAITKQGESGGND